MAKEEFLSVGGQAIVEGVMMRSPKYFAVACRAPNKELVVKAEPIEKTWIGRQKWLKVPFLRGSWALLDSMSLGIRAMRFASNVQLAPEYQPEGVQVVKNAETLTAQEQVKDAVVVKSEYSPEAGEKSNAIPDKLVDKRIQDGLVFGAIIFSLIFGIVFFKVIPQAIGTSLEHKANFSDRMTNTVVELIKAVFFMGYLWAISFNPAIKEVYRYHGAEHKAINTLEAEQELTMENCRAQTRLHPRCGTSFAIIVLLLGFVVYSQLPRVGKAGGFLGELFGNVGLHLAVLPLIAGAAYELLRFAGKFRDNSAIMVMFKPGLWTQLITTQEPRDDQIEVALASLKACLDGEESLKEAKA